MIFEIPLKDGSSVFMKGENMDCQVVVYVKTDEFLVFWNTSQKDDNVYEAWHSKSKMDKAIRAFANSEHSPVPLSRIDGVYKYDRGSEAITIRLGDGVTRIHCLLNKGAKEFPIYCDRRTLPSLEALISVKLI